MSLQGLEAVTSRCQLSSLSRGDCQFRVGEPENLERNTFYMGILTTLRYINKQQTKYPACAIYKYFFFTPSHPKVLAVTH